MEEQTSEAMVEDIDLFADEEADFYEPTSEEGEATEEAETAQMTEEEETPAEETAQTPAVENDSLLDIVYNGQAMQLNKQQAVELAQKGMNYDKLQQRLQEAQNSPERQLIARMAAESGMEVGAFMQSVEQQLASYKVNARANQLMNDNYLDADTAMRLAQTEIENESLRNQQAAAQKLQDERRQKYEQQLAENQRKKDTFIREIGELTRTYPDFKDKYPTIESMPEVMQAAIRNGESIKTAYQQVVIEELRQENAAYKQNQKNAASSTGSATGAGQMETDDFLGGLFSD